MFTDVMKSLAKFFDMGRGIDRSYRGKKERVKAHAGEKDKATKRRRRMNKIARKSRAFNARKAA